MNSKRFKFFADVIRHHAITRPDKIAMIFGDRATDYKEFNRHANQVASGLLAQGLEPQARVAFLSLNCDRFFELWQGASRAGLVTTPVNFRLAPAEICYILNDSQARMLFISKEFAGLVAQIEGRLNQVEQVILIDDSGDHSQESWLNWSDWLAGQEDSDPHHENSVNSTLIQYYSSGTTGFPKGVELSHANTLRHTPVWLEENGQWDETEVSLVAMPLFHVSGAAFGAAALVAGGTDVILPVVDPRGILSAIPEHRVTRICVVPAVIHAMLMIPQCHETDFSSVRRILYGGSPMPAALVKQATGVMGHCLEQTYGTTETGGGFTSLPPQDHHREDKLQSCGRPMSYVDIRVVDEVGADCPPGAVGEIIARGECVMKGYWLAPEATHEAIRDGWFHTGDAGYFDEDGYLFVHDRIHDMIVTGGENVYPAEVENALAGHEHIADVAVFGVPDDTWGEAVKAVIIPAPDTDPDLAGIIEFCGTLIARYKCPKSIDVVEEIPRNAAGKILKKDLRKPFWQGRSRRVN